MMKHEFEACLRELGQMKQTNFGREAQRENALQEA